MTNLFACRSKRQARKPPILLVYRSAKWFILSTVCVATFTDIFLYCLIVPVIPFALSQRAGIAENEVQHLVAILLAAYGGALLIASPICGWLADKSPNRRLPLLVGLLALGGATILLCLGQTIAVLVLGRILQGLSAAVVWTVGAALLVDTVGQKAIGQVMGYVALSMSLAFLLGPLLGGILYTNAGYYAVFYMAFGLIVLDILLRLALVEKKVAKKWIEQLALTDPGLPPLAPPTNSEILPIKDERQSPSASEPQPAEYKSRSSLPPVVTLLASRRLLATLWGILVSAALITSFDAVLPLHVQALFGWSSTGAGLIFLTIVIPTLIAPLVGHWSDKYGPRWLTAGGFLLMAPIMVLLRLVDHGGTGQIVLLCALLTLIGVGSCMSLTPLLAEITYVLEAKEKKVPGVFGDKGAYAQAYGLFNSSFAAGSLVGPIWGGFVVSGAGWNTMTWTLGLLSAVTIVPTVIWTGGLVTKRHGDTGRWASQERRVETGVS